jgi:hypothetical protein
MLVNYHQPMRPAIICCCLLTITLLPTPAAPPEHVKASDIHPERELLITDPVILDSAYAQYPGPWSFGALVEEIFGKEKAPEAIHRWLLCYAEESTTGAAPECLSPADFGAPLPAESKSAITRIKKGRSDSGSDDQPAIKIPPRSDIARKFVHDWQQCDGYNPASGLPWEPNLAHAPFRLLAIVNRMDLGVAPLVDTEGDLRTKWTNTGKERQLAAMIGLSTQGVHGITTFPSDQPASLSPYGGFGGLSRGNIAAASPRGFRGFRNLSSFTSTCVTPPPPQLGIERPEFRRRPPRLRRRGTRWSAASGRVDAHLRIQTRAAFQSRPHVSKQRPRLAYRAKLGAGVALARRPRAERSTVRGFARRHHQSLHTPATER